MWAGANCYYLHGLKDNDRIDVLNAFRDAGLKTLRIFITHVYYNAKNTGNDEIPDLEITPGQYNDKILNQIDNLMYEAYERGIKLIIAMHDRYALEKDFEAYKKAYGSKEAFYTNSDAQAVFDKRMAWIMYHKNPHFNFRPWYEIHEAIFSFEAENEAMGHMDMVNVNWQCNRAKVIKSIVRNGILVTTGGGIDFGTSMKSQYYECPYIDVLTLHFYDRDTNFIWSKVNEARDLAWKYGKRIIVEEFGANSDQVNAMSGIIDKIQGLDVPWMFWEVMKPGAGGKDFEIWTNEEPWNKVIKPKAQQAAQRYSGWSWPEIWSGDRD